MPCWETTGKRRLLDMEESKKDEARLICDWWMDFPDDIIALAM